MDLLEDLTWRGLVHQQTNAEALRQHLAQPRSVYCGFDSTADSLTIGHLVPILLLARFQRAGHRPVVVIGDGTGMIGDPSGKEAERPILSPEQIAKNVAGQRPIFEHLLEFSSANGALIVQNSSWLTKLSFIDALRDIGKHFSVNMMIQKDSVRERLQNREQGISYTEFSYMLLQAYDFLHLHQDQGVTLQVAGSDQWGNIVAGIDLIRRIRQVEAYGITAPLVTKADGGKFGKTESGAVWLTPDRTSPYAFYQFWLNTADADIPKYLRIFTLLEHGEIEALSAEHHSNPGGRAAHRALAAQMTRLVHGPEGLGDAEMVTQALFSGDVTRLSRSTIDDVFRNAPAATLEAARLSGDGLGAVDLLVDGQIAKSKREARELLSTHAVLINGRPVTVESRVSSDWLLFGEVALVRRGKKHWHVVRFR